jgi:hypothetical protein
MDAVARHAVRALQRRRRDDFDAVAMTLPPRPVTRRDVKKFVAQMRLWSPGVIRITDLGPFSA